MPDVARTLIQKHVITPQMVARKRKRRGSMPDQVVANILNYYIQADGDLRKMLVPDGILRSACLDAIQRWGPKVLPTELREGVLARRHIKRRARFPQWPQSISPTTDHHDLAGRIMALEQRMAAVQNGVQQRKGWPTGKMWRRGVGRRVRFLFTGR